MGLTVAVDLPAAVVPWLLLASALLVKRLSDTAHVAPGEEVTQGNAAGQQTAGHQIPTGVVVFRVFGAFFFGAADTLDTGLRESGRLSEVLILHTRDVLARDVTGLDALEDLFEKLRRQKRP